MSTYARYTEDCHEYGETIPFSKFDPGRWMVVEPNYLGDRSYGEGR
jgi:hypothetical protein